MRRRISQILLVTVTALSLLVFLGSAVFWVRSYGAEDYAGYNRAGIGSSAVWSRHGRLSVWNDWYDAAGVFRGRTPRPAGWQVQATPLSRSNRWPDGSQGKLGFVLNQDKTGRAPYTAVAVPWWAVTGLSGLVAGLGSFVWIRRRRRVPLGLCATCGYDLRASHDRCPECGTPIGRATKHNGRSLGTVAVA